MTIIIKDFDWKQNENHIIIILDLRKKCYKNIDVICATSYVKVNFNPFIFELFLNNKINSQSSKTSTKDGLLYVQLEKSVKEEWKIVALQVEDKKEAQRLRNEALKEFEKNEQKKHQEKKSEKISLERLSVSKQIAADEEQHELKKKFIEEEKQKFFAEEDSPSTSVVDRRRLSSLCSSDGSVAASEGDYDGDAESVTFSSSENLSGKGKRNASGRTRDRERSRNVHGKIQDNENIVLSSIRETQSIRIRHSPHAPSIPKRESTTKAAQQVSEESESDEKKNEIEEKRSQLKTEAINFFKNKDYERAIDAYSALIDMCPQASYLSNRAAAYIASNMHYNAVEDCTKALELLGPPSTENSKSRLLCLVRRGTSFVQMKYLSKGLLDYKSALEIDPHNVAIAKDVAVIQACLGSSTESDTTDVLEYTSEGEEDDINGQNYEDES